MKRYLTKGRRSSSTRKQPLAYLSLGLGALLLVSGVAWACTPTGYLELDPNYGRPGTPVIAGGRLPADAEVPVRIRWGSDTGTVLAEAQGPAFSVEITIPQVPYETYTVVAEATDGSRRWRAAAQFAVTDRVAPRRTSGPVIENYEGPTEAASSGADSDPRPAARQQTGDSNTDREQIPADGGGEPSAPTNSEDSASPVERTSAEAVRRAQAADPSVAEEQPRVQGGPALPSTPASPADQAKNLPAAVRSVSSDLWSGFERARAPLGGSPFELREESDQPSMPLLAGMVLLGFGAVLGAASMSMAVAHRRRSARPAS